MTVQPLESLLLSSKRTVWRMHDHADEADKEFQKIRAAILDAFQNTCVYCSHQSERYQEVHHRDDDHKNNKAQNLACACPLCHQIFHPGLASMREGADLVHVPELSQAEINQLALTIWLVDKVDVSKLAGESAVNIQRLKAKAKSIFGMIENRRGAVLLKFKDIILADPTNKFPKDLIPKVRLSHLTPGLLANVLMGLPDDAYANREKLLGGIRLLPKAVRFAKRLDFWSQEQAKGVPVQSWHKLIGEDRVPLLIQNVTAAIAAMGTPVPVSTGS